MKAPPKKKSPPLQAQRMEDDYTHDGKDFRANSANGKPAVLCCSDRFLQRAEDAARQLNRSWCDYGPKQVNEINPDMMPGILADVARGVLDATLNHGAVGFAGVYPYFTNAPRGILAEFCECSQAYSPRPQDCGPLIEIIREWRKAYRLDVLADNLRRTLERGENPAVVLREIAELEMESMSTSIADALAARSFDFDSHPEKPVPLFSLCGMALCTPGNLTNIQALPKAGKSAVVESMIAAVFNGNRKGPDTLGFAAENANEYALIHFDTEQSRYDADALIRRACHRVRVERPPAWLMSFAVADLDIKERRKALPHAMSEASEIHGGVFAVMIDGIGDLCTDPNNPEESFALVHELHSLAIRHNCTICTALHENPGSSESGKTRGHLGSQLERKAETNLRLAKDKYGITTIWAERARHCYLPKEQGPCFSWNDQAAMHTSCGTSGEIKSAATRTKMKAEAETAFGGQESFRHSDLQRAVSDAFEIKERAAKDRIRKWLAEGIIRKDSTGKYRLINP